MCICVFKPANKRLTREVLTFAYEQNGDGAGFAFADKDKSKLVIQKGFFTFKKFWKAFDKIQKGNPAIVHFRVATSGAKDADNCHPFYVNDNVAVAHNGTLVEWKPSEKSKSTKSDTQFFVDSILKPALEELPNMYLSPTYKYMLESTISNGNKLVFLDSKGRHSIIREWAGEYEEKDRKGCWFSNDTYKVPRLKKAIKDKTYTGDITLLSEEEMNAIEEELATRQEAEREKDRKFGYPKDSQIVTRFDQLTEGERNYLNGIVGNNNNSKILRPATPHDLKIHDFLALNGSDVRQMMR